MKGFTNVVFRKATCLLLALALVFPISFSASAASAEIPVDLSLVHELEWSRSVQIFSVERSEVYAPEGAQIMSVDLIGEVFSVDYRLDFVRYIVDYYPDGTVSKAARADGSNIVQSVSSDVDGVHVIDIEDRIYCTDGATAYANGKEMIPIMYTEVAGTKPLCGRMTQDIKTQHGDILRDLQHS